MSVEAITWAWKQPVNSQAERLILLALADSANGDTFECWPSHKFISEKALCSVATVKRAIKTLVESGLLSIRPRFNANEQQSNMYRVMVDPPVHSEPPVHNSDPTPVHSYELQNRNLTVHKYYWGEAPESIDSQAWQDWAAYKRGKPAQATITKTANFLRQYTTDQQRKVVDQSIRNTWKGLFPLKDNSNGQTGRSHQTSADLIDQRRRERIEHIRQLEAEADRTGAPSLVPHG